MTTNQTSKARAAALKAAAIEDEIRNADPRKPGYGEWVRERLAERERLMKEIEAAARKPEAGETDQSVCSPEAAAGARAFLAANAAAVTPLAEPEPAPAPEPEPRTDRDCPPPEHPLTRGSERIVREYDAWMEEHRLTYSPSTEWIGREARKLKFWDAMFGLRNAVLAGLAGGTIAIGAILLIVFLPNLLG